MTGRGVWTTDGGEGGGGRKEESESPLGYLVRSTKLSKGNLPSRQVDKFNGHIPLNSCLADRP